MLYWELGDEGYIMWCRIGVRSVGSHWGSFKIFCCLSGLSSLSLIGSQAGSLAKVAFAMLVMDHTPSS